MLDAARQLTEGIPTATLTALEGEEHVVDPDVLVPVVRKFLAQAAPASTAEHLHSMTGTPRGERRAGDGKIS